MSKPRDATEAVPNNSLSRTSSAQDNSSAHGPPIRLRQSVGSIHVSSARHPSLSHPHNRDADKPHDLKTQDGGGDYYAHDAALPTDVTESEQRNTAQNIPTAEAEPLNRIEKTGALTAPQPIGAEIASNEGHNNDESSSSLSEPSSSSSALMEVGDGCCPHSLTSQFRPELEVEDGDGAASHRLRQSCPSKNHQCCASHETSSSQVWTDLNSWWRQHLETTVEPFLGVEAMLMLRQTCTALKKYEFKLPKQNWAADIKPNAPHSLTNARMLTFNSLCGYDGQLICDKLLKLTVGALHPNIRRSDGVVLDFSQCILLKDAQLAFLTSSEHHGFVPAPPQPGTGKPVSTKLVGLKLDFCQSITDKGVSALMASHLPHFAYLSLNGIRSENFTGRVFKEALNSTLWPKLRHVCLNFTSISYDAVVGMAEFITNVSEPAPFNKVDGQSSLGQSDSLRPDIDSDSSSVNDNCNTLNDPTIKQLPDSQQFHSQSSVPTEGARPHIEFIGSTASKACLELIGAKSLIRSFTVALNSKEPVRVAQICMEADKEIDRLLLEKIRTDEPESVFSYLLRRGCEYLVNVPVTCATSEEGGVDVWTLPISVAISNGDLEMVKVLDKFGAQLNVVDHLGKSPLFRAVYTKNYEIAKYLISRGVQLAPLFLTSPSPLNIAVETRCTKLTKLLLECGYPLHLKCPAIRSFKSALHVACEIGDEELIHSLLDWGANPNTFSGSYKNSPAMLAYKANSRFLPVFLQGGAGGRLQSIPLMSDILSAAIAKNDVKSVELLVTLFPALLTRQHPTWSLPHIQAAKIGRDEILDTILAAFRSNVATNEQKFVAAEWYTEDPLLRPSENVCDKRKGGESSVKETQREDLSPAAQQFIAAYDGGLGLSSHDARITSERSSTKGEGSKKNRALRRSAAESGMQCTDNHYRPTLTDSKRPSKSGGQAASWNELELQTTSIREPTSSQALSTLAKNTVQGEMMSMSDLLATQDSQTGNTALHYAAEEGRVDCLVTLLRYGADVNVLNDNNQTALHLACQEDRNQVVHVLLYCGSCLSIRDRELFETPLMTAIRSRNDTLAMLILKYEEHQEEHDQADNNKTPPSSSLRSKRNSLTNESALSPTGGGDSDCSEDDKDDRSHRQTALEYSLYFGRYEIARQLMKRRQEIDDLLHDEEAANAAYATVCEKMSGTDANRVGSRRVLDRFIKLYKQRHSLTAALDAAAANAPQNKCGGSPTGLSGIPRSGSGSSWSDEVSGALRESGLNSSHDQPAGGGGGGSPSNKEEINNLPCARCQRMPPEWALAGSGHGGGNNAAPLCRSPGAAGNLEGLAMFSSHGLMTGGGGGGGIRGDVEDATVGVNGAVRSLVGSDTGLNDAADVGSQQAGPVLNRAKRLQGRLKSAARKPFQIFHRGSQKASETAHGNG